MSLRSKESLEKLFAESRERCAKKREREKNHGDYYFDDWDWDLEIHAPQIIATLVNKGKLNENEKKLLDSAFELAYPNGI